jgi:dipeptidyl aminopeptidase/acylaminoacyl peptidase
LTCYDNEFGPPWENLDLWVKYSYPFFKANKITTPTLFMGGQNDFNVPTLLVIYPGQNHGLTKVPFLRDRLERYLAWYAKYLKSDLSKTSSAQP